MPSAAPSPARIRVRETPKPARTDRDPDRETRADPARKAPRGSPRRACNPFTRQRSAVRVCVRPLRKPPLRRGFLRFRPELAAADLAKCHPGGHPDRSRSTVRPVRGSLRQTGPGRYQLRVYRGRDADGRKLYTGRVHRGTKRSAETALRELVSEIESSRAAVEDTRQTLRAWLGVWRDRHSTSWSPTTLARADAVIRVDLGALGDVELERLRPADVQAWTDAQVARGLAPATVRRSFGVIRSALEEAVRLELLARNPAARISLPKLRRREFPDVNLAAALAAATTIGDRTLVRIAAATGARRGQIVGLRWSDVDADAGLVTFSRNIVKQDGGWTAKELKSGNLVRVSVDPGTLAVLAECAADQVARAELAAVDLDPDPFYLARDLAGAEPWYPDTATSRWRQIAQAAGLDGVRLHDLRHAHATELIAAGVDVATVAARLGHASPAVTLRIYAHPVTAADRAASEIAGRLLGADGGSDPAE